MTLEFENRDNLQKKILIYGEDGSGKSTFAEKYCKNNNLNPVCIDVEKTNFTTVPILKCDLGNDKKAVRNITAIISELQGSKYDTLIIDGISTLLEILVSEARGLAKYSDRASNFQKILTATLNSGLNIIFIGQIDMEVIHTPDTQSNKQVIKINSLVNEKYLTVKQGDGEEAKYGHIVKKFRG
jgi:GTPase SAR1 family protein